MLNMPILILSEKLRLSGTQNDYTLLEVGKFASSKYNGVLSAKNPSLNRGPGIIEVKQDWIDAVVSNYQAGALETVPFIDELHARGISLGPITNVRSEGGKLILTIDWNERGKEYIRKNEYMYLSIDADQHLVSKDFGNFKMGQYVYPVLYGAGICNDPVYKNQKTLQESTQFSEKGEPTGTKILIFGEHKTKNSEGGILMKELFTKLIEAVKAAITGADAETAKTEIQGYISELQNTIGASPEMKASEAKIKTLTDEVESLKADKVTLTEKIKLSEKDENGQIGELSTRLTESEKRNSSLLVKFSTMEFDQKFLNKKVTPAQRDKYLKLYLADAETAESVINDLPEIKLGDSEDGQSGDMKANNGGTLALETQFAEETKKIAARDKINFSEAYQKAKVEKSDLWNKLNEGGSK